MKRGKKILSKIIIMGMVFSNMLTSVIYAIDNDEVKNQEKNCTTNENLRNGGFTVNETGEDTEPPTIEKQSIKVDKESVDFGDRINISVKATDDKSGVKVVNICYIMPIGQKRKYIDLKYNETTGLYEGSMLINKYFEEGKWEVNYLFLEDISGNCKSIYEDEYLDSGSFVVNMTKGQKGTVQVIGRDRYETATKLSINQFSLAETVVIANGTAMADGLTVTPLASYLEAPLLLTETDSIPNSTISEIVRLGAKKAIIVGGTGVVSDNISKELQGLGITSVERIGGKDRYETSLLIGKYISDNFNIDIDSVFICNGYGEADSLSIASAAGSDKVPIILVEKDSIETEAYEWMKSQFLSNAFVIGGTGVVSDKVLNRVKGITGSQYTPRFGGKDRYETNAIVLKNLYVKADLDKIVYLPPRRSCTYSIFIAKGNELVDALSAGPVAALNGAPVVLAEDDLTYEQKTSLSGIKFDTIFRTGGGISDKAVNSLESLIMK